MNLMPGSNPLFGSQHPGRRTGGQTKEPPIRVRRCSSPAAAATAAHLEFTHGGFNDDNGLEWFFAGNLYRDSGAYQLAVRRAPALRQTGLAGCPHRHRSRHRAYADNKLNGLAACRKNMLEQDYSSIYTPTGHHPEPLDLPSTSPAATAW